MFSTKPAVKDERLDLVTDRLFAYLTSTSVDTEEYGTVIEHLVKIQKLKEATIPSRLSPDAKATIAANLFGILAVIGYERIHIITTKALGLIGKLH